MFIKLIKLMLIVSLYCTTEAYAACVCMCVSGVYQPVCQNAFDFRPMCPPTVCMPTMPAAKPIQMPFIRPIGTKSCNVEQVCDNWGNCVWKTICR